MTRANINFINKKGKTFFFYWNGDQYPTGLRDIYKVLNFVKSEMTEQSFKDWARDNYENISVKQITHPKIYYTDQFITDYSYVFDTFSNQILVYEWDKQIFSGDQLAFIRWIKKQ